MTANIVFFPRSMLAPGDFPGQLISRIVLWLQPLAAATKARGPRDPRCRQAYDDPAVWSQEIAAPASPPCRHTTIANAGHWHSLPVGLTPGSDDAERASRREERHEIAVPVFRDDCRSLPHGPFSRRSSG